MGLALVVALAASWTLVWSDEFEGPAGTRPDPKKWTFDVGGHGWGNDELQHYTDRRENAALDGEGRLAIRARREAWTADDGTTREYTSARLKTVGLFEPTHGRVEARIQVPGGQGIWPAFWMLGHDIAWVGWPACGEIDVMENIGREPGQVHGSLHGPGFSGDKGLSAATRLPDRGRLADGFHVFATEWEPGSVRFLLDDAAYATFTPADVPAGGHWAFEHPFFLLLNVAVGGRWPGSPDATTEFPQAMLVDYVRVYRRQP